MSKSTIPNPAVGDQTKPEGYAAVISAPLTEYPFKLGIYCNDDALIGIDFLDTASQNQAPVTALAREVVRQLHAYFADPYFHFDLPLAVQGTVFQRQVWDVLRRMTPGMPQSYGEVAQKLQSCARAVGGACRRNPTPIVVPCHRVVARQGPGGFVGATQGHAVMIKQWLLDHEACA